MGKDNLSGKKKYNNGIIAKYFVPGEQPEGWVEGSTEEKKNKNSEAQKKLWQNTEYRNHQVKLRNTDAYHQIQSDASKRGYENSDKEARKLAAKSGAQSRFSREEEREKASDRMINKWTEDEYRENQIQALKDGHKDIYLKHPEYRDTLSKSNSKAWANNKVEILKKQYLTKTKNNSFNSSKPEDDFYNYLLTIYNVDDIERQYSIDPRYPFNCDFYVKSEDLFIEYQGTWTHGGHPFDETNLDDIYKLEQWQEKAKTSSYYKNAIRVWTVLDPLKIKTAQNNNLNIKFIY